MSVAGWFPDPSDPGLLRYWDGAAWTDEVRPMPSTSVLPPMPPFGVDPASTRRRPGTVDVRSPVAAWEDTAHHRRAAVDGAVHRTPSAGRRRPVWRIALFGVLAIGVVAGAAFGVWKFADTVGGAGEFDRPGAVVSAGDGDGSAADADVITALLRHGITCASDAAALPHGDIVAAVERIAADAAAGPADVRDATDDFVRAVKALDPTVAATLTPCGRSLLVVTAGTARYGFFDGAAPPAVAAVSDLDSGSCRGPTHDDRHDRPRRDRGETCPLPADHVEDVLLAELLPRLAPADGSVPTPATMAKVAVDGLRSGDRRPQLHPHRVLKRTWAERSRILSPDSEVTAASLGHVDVNRSVVGPDRHRRRRLSPGRSTTMATTLRRRESAGCGRCPAPPRGTPRVSAPNPTASARRSRCSAVHDGAQHHRASHTRIGRFGAWTTTRLPCLSWNHGSRSWAMARNATGQGALAGLAPRRVWARRSATPEEVAVADDELHEPQRPERRHVGAVGEEGSGAVGPFRRPALGHGDEDGGEGQSGERHRHERNGLGEAGPAAARPAAGVLA